MKCVLLSVTASPVLSCSQNEQARKKLNLVKLPTLVPGNWKRTPLASAKPAANPGTPTQRPMFFTKGTIPALERKWWIIPACPTYAGRTLSTAISKNGYKTGTSFRSRCAANWCSCTLGFVKTSIIEGVRRQRSARIFGTRMDIEHIQQGINKVGFGCCVKSQKMLGILACYPRTHWLAVVQMESSLISYRMFFQNEIFPRAPTCCERKRFKKRKTDNLLHATQPFRRGRNSSWWPVSSEKVSLHQQLDTWSRRRFFCKMIQRTGSRMTIWQTKSHVIIVHKQVPPDCTLISGLFSRDYWHRTSI